MSTWTVDMKQKAAQKANTQHTTKSNEPSCYCPHCGKAQWPKHNYCSHCGHRVAELHQLVARQRYATYTPVEE